jgi:hypothetical protein
VYFALGCFTGCILRFWPSRWFKKLATNQIALASLGHISLVAALDEAVTYPYCRLR